MALVKANLASALLTAFNNCKPTKEHPEGVTEETLANAIADAIHNYVSVATVSGTATVTSAPGTAPVTGSLS